MIHVFMVKIVLQRVRFCGLHAITNSPFYVESMYCLQYSYPYEGLCGSLKTLLDISINLYFLFMMNLRSVKVDT